MAKTDTHLHAPQTHTQPHDKDRVLRIMMRAVFALLVVIVTMVAWARMTDRPLEAVRPMIPVVDQRDIVLISDTSGGALVRDTDGAVLIELASGQGGFLHTMWRAVQRERTRHRVAQDTPITVALHENGRMSLYDPSTDLRIDLDSFGSSNSTAFRAVLEE